MNTKLNNIKMKTLLYILPAILLLAACSKKEDAKPDFDESEKAVLSIQFDNIAGDKNLVLNNSTYTNALGQQFTVSMLQYFISNIKVKTTDGQDYTVPQDSSYFLIKEGDAASQFAKMKVPVGDYQSLTFTIGVDSLRSTMDISKRTGVLDPSGDHSTSGMYWTWNSGYIFLKLEGSSPAASSADKKVRYHIGGFGGYSAPGINNIKTITVDLKTGGIAKVRKDRNSNIHLFADIMKVFNGSTNVSFTDNPSVMSGSFSSLVAANYTSMFTHDHTEN
jgi:hypothetical protein